MGQRGRYCNGNRASPLEPLVSDEGCEQGALASFCRAGDQPLPPDADCHPLGQGQEVPAHADLSGGVPSDRVQGPMPSLGTPCRLVSVGSHSLSCPLPPPVLSDSVRMRPQGKPGPSGLRHQAGSERMHGLPRSQPGPGAPRPHSPTKAAPSAGLPLTRPAGSDPPGAMGSGEATSESGTYPLARLSPCPSLHQAPRRGATRPTLALPRP